MSSLGGVVLHIHGPDTAADQLEAMKDVYAKAFFPPPLNYGTANLDRMVGAWPNRLKAPGFRLVVAEVDGGMIGCTYGHQLAATTKWWDGAIGPLPDDVIREYEDRTFATIDMMVDPAWQRRGVAQAVHSHLLTNRTEERATLLVNPINTPARAAYAKWGYEVVGRIQPFRDMPKFEAMVKTLRE